MYKLTEVNKERTVQFNVYKKNGHWTADFRFKEADGETEFSWY